MRAAWVVGVVVLVGAASGCGKKTDDAAAVPSVATPGGSSSAGATAAHADMKPAATHAVGPGGAYPPYGTQIPSSCEEPAVLLATIPSSAPPDYAYPWTRETMLVHDDFVQVRDLGALASTAKGVMYFQAHVKDARALVARCHDAATCNKLSAMYKAVVRTSAPEAGCGFKAVGVTDAPVAKPLDLSLPGKDTIARCARINACLVATDHATPGNPGIECQKAPSKFKLDCAGEAKCKDVLACMGK
jgi:hypothetical protein